MDEMLWLRLFLRLIELVNFGVGCIVGVFQQDYDKAAFFILVSISLHLTIMDLNARGEEGR